MFHRISNCEPLTVECVNDKNEILETFYLDNPKFWAVCLNENDEKEINYEYESFELLFWDFTHFLNSIYKGENVFSGIINNEYSKIRVTFSIIDAK